MSMGEYYLDQEMEALAKHDNEIERLEEIAQAKRLEDKTKKLIQKQAKIIIDAAIAVRDKEWSKLSDAQEEYIKLLGDEIKGMATLAVIHGYHSEKAEAGRVCREKIKQLLKDMGVGNGKV